MSSSDDLDATRNNNNEISLISETVTLGDVNFCLHEWKNSNNAAAASTSTKNVIVIIFHGFLAHGLYPTVRYAAEFLSSSNNNNNNNNTIVVAPDLRGHGQSSGLSGYLPSPDILLQDGVSIVEYVAQKYYTTTTAAHHHQQPKIVLLGSSMGGTIALQVAMKIKNKNKEANTRITNDQDPSTSSSTSINIDGVILLAPMLKLNVDYISRNILSVLSHFIPTWNIIPSNNSTSSEKQYRDAIKRHECESDPYVSSSSSSNNNKIRVASASTCVELAGQMYDDNDNSSSFFKSVDIPFFLAVAEQDVVVDNQGCYDLYRESTLSQNKIMKTYPALHGLLCEPSPLFDTIRNDILEWLDKITVE